MMNLHWLLRAKRLAQSPPSMGRVYLVLAIIAVSIGLVIIERTIGWPDALTVERMGRF